MPEFLRYYILHNPSLTAGLVNFGLSAWLVYSALKTHYVLTRSYHALPPAVMRKRMAFRPLCVQASRAAAVFGLAYCLGEFHWIAGEKWDAIGNPEDMAWCVIEGMGMYTILLWLKLGRIVARQNMSRRSRDGRCPNETACDVRKRCLERLL